MRSEVNFPSIALINQSPRIEDNPSIVNAFKKSEKILIVNYEPFNLHPNKNVASWKSRALRCLKNRVRNTKSASFLEADSMDALLNICRIRKVKHVYWSSSSDFLVRNEENFLKQNLSKAGIQAHVEENLEFLLIQGLERPFKTFKSFWRQLESLILNNWIYQKPQYQNGNITHALTSFYKETSESIKNNHEASCNKSCETGGAQYLNNLLHSKIPFKLEEGISLETSFTSGLSSCISAGTIGSLRILKEIHALSDSQELPHIQNVKRGIGWRLFSRHCMKLNPDMDTVSIDKRFESINWSENQTKLELWKNGMTGYPIVDASMRKLHRTGDIDNRARMICASFLVKHLLIHWTHGANHFKEYLVDFDLAANSFNWQWVTGCGLNSAPYFRIFNPTIQAKRFDPKGYYIKRWIPELSSMPTESVHEPWKYQNNGSSNKTNKEGADDLYPSPVVDLNEARIKALFEYKEGLK